MEPLRALWNHLDKIIQKLERDLDRVDWLYRLTKSVKAKRQLRANAQRLAPADNRRARTRTSRRNVARCTIATTLKSRVALFPKQLGTSC